MDPKRNIVDIDPKDTVVTQTQGGTLLSHKPKPGRKELTLPCQSLLQTQDKHCVHYRLEWLLFALFLKDAEEFLFSSITRDVSLIGPNLFALHTSVSA